MDRKDINSPPQKVKKSNHWKLIIMTLFVGIDIALNSSLDYDPYSQTGRNNTLILGLLGFELIIQICIFLVVFLTIADTFLFRVGLLNILLKKIRVTLVIQIIYCVLTFVAGMVRYNHYSSGGNLLNLMKNSTFVGASFAHKGIAVIYYLANFNTIMKLEDPIYLNKESWIRLMKEVSKSRYSYPQW